MYDCLHFLTCKIIQQIDVSLYLPSISELSGGGLVKYR
jgi:hypothetical protein